MSDTRKPQPLTLTDEHVEAILDRVAALMYADIRPTLAKRGADKRRTERAVAAADNVVSLSQRRSGAVAS